MQTVCDLNILQLHLGNLNKAASELPMWSRHWDKETEAPFFTPWEHPPA